jgi:hypothetical protein
MNAVNDIEFQTKGLNVDHISEDDESIDGSNSNNEHDSTDNDVTVVNSSETNYKNATTEVRHSLQGEDRHVYMWRLVVRIIMIVMAVLITTATHLQLLNSEENDFKAAVSYFRDNVNLLFPNRKTI